MTGYARIIRGNALALPLADATVDLVVTSPPYFSLRSYTDGGEHYAGQIGSEATPTEFVDALIAATREMVRVLKPSGSIWVNLGDKYSGATSGDRNTGFNERSGNAPGLRAQERSQVKGIAAVGMRPKTLIGIPWRYALRCIDELGLILRAEIIWCLSGGARVYARINGKDRPLMLRDLARSYRPESVQLWNGERWTRVLGWNKTPDDAGALELELRTGERIGCTPGHQWPTARGLLRADEIRVGDVVQTTALPEPEKPNRPLCLPPYDIGWLVGLYIAEGSRSGKMLQFAGHINETARHAKLARIAEKLDGSSAVYQTSENGATCNLSGSVILGVIDRYVSAGTAKTKRLTKAAWQRDNLFLASVVEGYLEGDGHLDAKNDRWRLGFCANDEWAADLRTLAARLGAKISLRRSSFSGSYGTFPGWRGEWRWTRSAHHNTKPDGQVVAIRASRARDFYDVGVADEPHLFVLASGVLTHNSKPNGLPESVTDRVRRSHEQWFHLVTQPRYFSAVDEIREESATVISASGAVRYRRPGDENQLAGTINRTASLDRAKAVADHTPGGTNGLYDGLRHGANPLGKLPGSVWTIPTQPLTVPPELGVDHFAAFPMEWPRRIIQGWSPAGVCTVCGEGRRPVVQYVRVDIERIREEVNGENSRTRRLGANSMLRSNRSGGQYPPRTIKGYVCACTPFHWEPADDPDDLPIKVWDWHLWDPPPITPGVVVDVFGGTGTTALVAKALGRIGISVDMSADYCRLAEWRCTDPGQMAAALQVGRPDPVSPDQLDLFSEVPA